MSASLTRFTWELAVLGPDGPSSSTMTLVLLVIGSHVRRPGSVECWPSIRTLEAETRLSQRSIIDQIEGALALGWISRRTGQTGNMRRRGSIYSLTLPSAERHSAVTRSATAERPSAVNHRRPLNVTQPTAERDSSRPLNVVPSLLTSEVRKKEKAVEVKGNGADRDRVGEVEANGNGGGAQRKRFDGLAAWANDHRIDKGAGESDVDFNKRTLAAYLAHERKRSP